jgi:hypothetical protein
MRPQKYVVIHTKLQIRFNAEHDMRVQLSETVSDIAPLLSSQQIHVAIVK